MSEGLKNPESISEKVKILLHLFRHDDKEKADKSDTNIRLSEAGKVHASSLASEETTYEKAKVIGSPRERTQETGARVAYGAQENMSEVESLEDINAILNNKDLVGKQNIRVSQNLDFTLGEKGPYYDELMSNFKAGKLLQYLVEQSDKRAEELGAKPGVCSYDNQASQIAEVVAHYFKAFPRYEKLVNEKSEEGEKMTMERFLCSHMTVTESFLAKIIESTKGVAERDAFVASLGGGGFGLAEGYTVEITTDDNGEEKAHIVFKKEKEGQTTFEFDEMVSGEVIDSLIKK